MQSLSRQFIRIWAMLAILEAHPRLSERDVAYLAGLWKLSERTVRRVQVIATEIAPVVQDQRKGLIRERHSGGHASEPAGQHWKAIAKRARALLEAGGNQQRCSKAGD